MFLALLGGSLLVGASLFAAASFSDGALVAAQTAAQVIGWLFLLAALVAIPVLRREAGEISAAAITLCSGLALLYMATFGWSKPPAALDDAVAQVAPPPLFAYKLTDDMALTRASLQTVRPPEVPRVETKSPRAKETVARPAPAAVPCAGLEGVESLQCSRCSERIGLAWLVCQERVRLEYCESEQGNEALCPSPIPSSAPG